MLGIGCAPHDDGRIPGKAVAGEPPAQEAQAVGGGAVEAGHVEQATAIELSGLLVDADSRIAAPLGPRWGRKLTAIDEGRSAIDRVPEPQNRMARCELE